MRKEYPPMLTGQPENQLAQLRAYLVRLINYIDEALRDINAGGASEAQQAALAEWQLSTNTAIGSLRSAVRDSDLVQHGAVTETTNVVFPKLYADTPVIIATAGTVSNVSASGFTLTTSSAAQWIAVGARR